MFHWVELVGDFFGCVYLHHLSPNGLLVFCFAAKEDVNINAKFHGAGVDEVGRESRPILPFEREFGPGELGKLPPALELASDHGKCVSTDQA